MFPLAIKYQGKKTIHIASTAMRITVGLFAALVLYLIRPIFSESIDAQTAELITIDNMAGLGAYIPTTRRPNVTERETNQTIVSLSLRMCKRRVPDLNFNLTSYLAFLNFVTKAYKSWEIFPIVDSNRIHFRLGFLVSADHGAEFPVMFFNKGTNLAANSSTNPYNLKLVWNFGWCYGISCAHFWSRP